MIIPINVATVGLPKTLQAILEVLITTRVNLKLIERRATEKGKELMVYIPLQTTLAESILEIEIVGRGIMKEEAGKKVQREEIEIKVEREKKVLENLLEVGIMKRNIRLEEMIEAQIVVGITGNGHLLMVVVVAVAMVVGVVRRVIGRAHPLEAVAVAVVGIVEMHLLLKQLVQGVENVEQLLVHLLDLVVPYDLNLQWKLPLQ